MNSPMFSPRLLRVAVPAGLTLGGMFCGYLAITATLRGAVIAAAWLIIAAGLLDAFDGPLARALHGDSTFGGELDSFADLISFGVAPSVLLYRAYFSHWSVLGLLLAFMPLAVTALRLSRYNITARAPGREYFTGFTSTASGCLLASFVLFSEGFSDRLMVAVAAAGLVVIASILMVSMVPYMTVGKFTAGGVWKTREGALWLPVGLSVVVYPYKAFFLAMLTVMLQGLVGPRIHQVLEHRHAGRR